MTYLVKTHDVATKDSAVTHLKCVWSKQTMETPKSVFINPNYTEDR
jgi:hypothetical protein